MFFSGEFEPPRQTRLVVDILLHCLDGWKPPDIGVPRVWLLQNSLLHYAHWHFRVKSVVCMFPLIKSLSSELPCEFQGTSVDPNEGSVGIQRNSWDNFDRMEACHFEFMQCEAINTLTTMFLQVQHSNTQTFGSFTSIPEESTCS